MNGWTIVEEEVDSVYLTMHEIFSIYKLNLSDNPQLIRYRDDFVPGCITGLRFSHFSEIEREDVRAGMLFKKQNKSEHWVVIPLRDEAKELLNRRFQQSSLQIANANFNKHIKTLAKMAGLTEQIKFSHKKNGKDVMESKPKYAWITSDTCRRSFVQMNSSPEHLLNLL